MFSEQYTTDVFKPYVISTFCVVDGMNLATYKGTV